MFKVPKKTSVFKSYNKSPQDTVAFAPELIRFIADRRKWRTYRLADNKYSKFQIGDIVNIRESGKEKIIWKARVANIIPAHFKDLPQKTESAHESYKDKEHQRKVFNGYYAFLRRPIQDDDQFLIVDFELI